MDCCPFHVAAGDALKALHHLKKMPCDPLWLPLVGGQCAGCGAMFETDSNDGCDEFCEFCGGLVSSETRAPDLKSDSDISSEYEEDHPSVGAGIASAITPRAMQL